MTQGSNANSNFSNAENTQHNTSLDRTTKMEHPEEIFDAINQAQPEPLSALGGITQPQKIELVLTPHSVLPKLSMRHEDFLYMCVINDILKENDIYNQYIVENANRGLLDLSFGSLTRLGLQQQIKYNLKYHLSKLLTNENNYTILTLEKQTISKDVAVTLSNILKHNHTLQTLILTMCNLHAEEIKLIMDSLKENASITELKIGGNDAGDEGANAIAELLEQNKSIISMRIGGNEIQNDGCIILLKALERNTTLNELNFRENKTTFFDSNPANTDLIIYKNSFKTQVSNLDSGNILLNKALELGNKECISYVTNLKSTSGNTLLHSAVEEGKEGIMRNLLEHGANINEQNSLGYTPLHLAILNDERHIITLLLSANASLTIRDHQERTPYDLALEKGNIEVQELFKEADTATTSHQDYASPSTESQEIESILQGEIPSIED